MARFTVDLDVDAPADRVWSALVDWPAHSDWVPLTRVTVTSPRPDGLGATFVGRTGIGPLAFNDPMVVTEWHPPQGGRSGRCAVRKTGRVVRGSAQFTVASRGPDTSHVSWTEEVELPPAALTRHLAPLTSFVGRLTFARSLRRMARSLAAPAEA